MILDQFWLTDAQFSKIAPYLPTDTRGNALRLPSGDQRDHSCAQIRRAAHRRAAGLWAEEDALQSLCPLGHQGRLGGVVPRARTSRRAARAGSHRLLGGEVGSLGQRRQRGRRISPSGDGRTTKIHALTDAQCRPLAFMLTGGRIADGTAGAEHLAQLPACDILHGDKGYDSDAHQPAG